MTKIYNSEVTNPDHQYTILADNTFRLEDNGMLYEAYIARTTNSPYNLGNGAKATELTFRQVWKIKKDGTRGMQLTPRNERLWAIARALTV